MITHTLSSDAAVSLELGRRIAATEERRRRQHPSRLSLMWHRLFDRPAVRFIRAHA